jgi:hypothetical protein
VSSLPPRFWIAAFLFCRSALLVELDARTDAHVIRSCSADGVGERLGAAEPRLERIGGNQQRLKVKTIVLRLMPGGLGERGSSCLLSLFDRTTARAERPVGELAQRLRY